MKAFFCYTFVLVSSIFPVYESTYKCYEIVVYKKDCKTYNYLAPNCYKWDHSSCPPPSITTQETHCSSYDCIFVRLCYSAFLGFGILMRFIYICRVQVTAAYHKSQRATSIYWKKKARRRTTPLSPTAPHRSLLHHARFRLPRLPLFFLHLLFSFPPRIRFRLRLRHFP